MVVLFRYLVAAHAFVCLCTGSGVTFVEDDSFVKLRSEGLASVGFVESRDPDDFSNKMALTFKELRLLTPGNNDLFKTGSETFDIQPSGFHRHLSYNVHAMSMNLNIPALGIVLAVKGAILKQNGLLHVTDGDDVELRRGDVIVSLELTPTHDDQMCIACQVDAGHVIQIDVDVTHVGVPECRQIREDMTSLRIYRYSDGATFYIPEEVMVDGVAQKADITVMTSENNHDVTFRLPAPLGQKMSVSLVFRVPKPEPEPATTTLKPKLGTDPVRKSGKRKSSEQHSRNGERSRDHVNMAEDQPERKVVEVQYTTTTKSPRNLEEKSKAIVSVKDHSSNGVSRDSVCIALLILVLFTLLA